MGCLSTATKSAEKLKLFVKGARSHETSVCLWFVMHFYSVFFRYLICSTYTRIQCDLVFFFLLIFFPNLSLNKFLS